MADQRGLTELSKFLALILRHQPERFALALNDEGWASLSEVMEILKGLPNFRSATKSDVMHVVEQGTGDGRRRLQVVEGRIRALYGHSSAGRVRHKRARQPDRLYHGTAPERLPTVREEGLRPMARQYDHLSPDWETAIRVGSRHAPRLIAITVCAAEAHEAGIAFYHPAEGIYLAARISPAFLDFEA